MRPPCAVLFPAVLSLFCLSAKAETRDELVDAAIERARLDDVESLVSRARWSALVPDVRVTVHRGFGQGISGQPVQHDDGWTRLSLDQSFSFNVAANFDLSRLVFAPEEPRMQALRDSSVERLRLADAVLERYEAICAAMRDENGRQVARLRIELEQLTGRRLRGLATRLECAELPRQERDER